MALPKGGGADVIAKCRNPHDDFRWSFGGKVSGQPREVVFASAEKFEDEFAELG